ncbi:MAG: flagellar biosynthesis anti-sigma factor FlgM [Burkholderiaceae bacterium]|nr:flagellar biosynthesis anti-sigma factor FlgM [Burkholderiaceae bacterium]
MALRAAIADGRYRVDPEVIAGKLLMTFHLQPQLSDPLH